MRPIPTVSVLAALFLTSACSLMFGPAPASPPGSEPGHTGDYKQFNIGFVRSPEGVAGGNGCYDDKGKFIVLINNNDATDPTYSQLLKFLQQDGTDEFPYQLQLNPNAVYYEKPENLVNLPRVQNIIDGLGVPDPPLICADFAERLHNNAEQAGIRCGYVTIDFEGRTIGHAVAVFNTTDKGLIYVDDTGVSKHISDLDVSPGANVSSSSSNDKVAYITTGKAYGLITLENAADFGTNYTGYENWLITQKELGALENKYKDLQKQIAPIKAQINDLTAEYTVLKEQYDQITGGRTTLPPNIYNQALPVMTKMNAVNDKRNALIGTMNSLVGQVNNIVEQYNSLAKRMGPTWESLGIVSNFYVTWDGEWGN